MSTKQNLEKLARYRTIGARHSDEVFKLGSQALASGGRGLGEQEWAIREQVAIAALDLGEGVEANKQIDILLNKFPHSPRVATLMGLQLEAAGNYGSAKKLYRSLLGLNPDPSVGEKGKGKVWVEGDVRWEGEGDETFITAHQRLISLGLYSTPNLTPQPARTNPSSLPTPSTENIIRTLPLLIAYLDIFHTDPDAWSLLADLYLLLSGWSEVDNAWYRGEIVQKLFPESAGKISAGGLGAGGEVGEKKFGGEYLQQAMSCFAQRLVMEGWNWMTMVRYGEMGLMLGDVPMAYKTFLRAVEMATDPTDTTTPTITPSSTSSNLLDAMTADGWRTRVWWNLKICTTYLSKPDYDFSPTSLSPTPPEYVAQIDALVDEKLTSLAGKEALLAWKNVFG